MDVQLYRFRTLDPATDERWVLTVTPNEGEDELDCLIAGLNEVAERGHIIVDLLVDGS